MMTQGNKAREFTGRHMLAVMMAFFGTIIAVNAFMATMASRSWTGLVVKNTYVASQQFNERAAQGRAQAALGWNGTLSIGPAGVSYRLTDASGSPVAMKAVAAKFRRPAYEAEDQTLTLKPVAGDGFASPEIMRDGIWIVEVDADVGTASPYREVRRLVIANGAVK